MNSILKATPRTLKSMLIMAFKADLVPFIHGQPGIGKSTIMAQVAKEFELELIDHRLSTSDPTDMSGFPGMRDGKARFFPFEELFPLQSTPIPEGKEGWLLFLDEANAASRAVQAASYKLVLDRKVGQHRLHEKVVIAMAGNLASDRAIVNPLSTAMQSRVVHIELTVNPDQWMEDVALKESYDSRIIGYLSMYPGHLMDFRPDHQEHTFCCPRTWEFVQRLLRTEDGIEQPITDELKILLSGVITPGVAFEFFKFAELYKNLISIQEICKDPKTCRIPPNSQKDLLWAVVTSMLDKVTTDNFDNLATYADRLDLSFRILFYRSVMIRNPKMRTHKDFSQHVRHISKYLAGEEPVP